MKIFAYTTPTFRRTTRAAVGHRALLVTCPPTTATTFNPRWLQSDLVFINLHGFPQEPYLYGDDWQTALDPHNIANLDLSHTVMVIASCFFPSSPLQHTLLTVPHPPRLLVAGAGPNYTNPRHLSGPALLTRHIRHALGLHIPPHTAFKLARVLLRLAPPTLATTDTLNFQIFTS